MTAVWLAFAIIIVMITLYLVWIPKEKFSSKREKAKRIFDWFSEHKSPSYAEYRSDLEYKSNIVEYEDVKKLFDKKNLTIESVENAI